MSAYFTCLEEKGNVESTTYFRLYIDKLRKLLEGARDCCVTEVEVRFSQGEAYAYKRAIEAWDTLIEEIKKQPLDKEK